MAEKKLTRKWSFHEALLASNKRPKHPALRTTESLNSSTKSPKVPKIFRQLTLPETDRDIDNCVQSCRTKKLVLISKRRSEEISDHEAAEEGVGRVDTYSHWLLSESDQSDKKKQVAVIGQQNHSTSLALAKGMLALSLCEISVGVTPSLSFVTMNKNSVTVVGATKTGKTTLIQRMNLFSSSEGFLRPNESPVTFLEVTGTLDADNNLSEALIVLLMALNDEQSLVSCENCLTNYFEKRESVVQKKAVLLVANKCDVGTRTAAKILQGARALANGFSVRFLEVSALTNYNIGNLWEAIKQMLVEEKAFESAKTDPIL